MAKQRHQQTQQNSKTPLIAMAIGGLLMAALVVWALTRTVDRTPTSTIAAPADQTQTFPTATSATTTYAPTPAVDTATNTASPVTSLPMATSSQPPLQVSEHSQTPEKAAVKRISAEDLRERMNRGEVTVVDVRAAEAYSAMHIKGSISIPMASVQANLDRLPKGKDVVAYCT